LRREIYIKGILYMLYMKPAVENGVCPNNYGLIFAIAFGG